MLIHRDWLVMVKASRQLSAIKCSVLTQLSASPVFQSEAISIFFIVRSGLSGLARKRMVNVRALRRAFSSSLEESQAGEERYVRHGVTSS